MRSILPLFLFGLLACTSTTAPSPKHDKDLSGFTLPGSITTVVPAAEYHLQQSVRYVSPRFPVKPEFVFIDGADTPVEDFVLGRPDPSVKRLNMVHLSVRIDGAMQWTGAVLIGENKATAMATAGGQILQLTLEDDQRKVSLSFNDWTAETVFSHRDDQLIRLIDGNREVWVYYYVFPEELYPKGPVNIQ